MKKPQTHATLLALVGGYILFIAYQLLQGQRAETPDMDAIVAYPLIIFFAIGGIAVLLYAFITWKSVPKNGGNEDGEDGHTNL